MGHVVAQLALPRRPAAILILASIEPPHESLGDSSAHLRGYAILIPLMLKLPEISGQLQRRTMISNPDGDHQRIPLLYLLHIGICADILLPMLLHQERGGIEDPHARVERPCHPRRSRRENAVLRFRRLPPLPIHPLFGRGESQRERSFRSAGEIRILDLLPIFEPGLPKEPQPPPLPPPAP